MILAPPPAYDHPYPGPLTVWRKPAALADVHCHAARGWRDFGLKIYGCQFKLGGHCFVIVSKGPDRDALLRHEVAHCNGWTHPGTKGVQ